jgi:hypothetical protein
MKEWRRRIVDDAQRDPNTPNEKKPLRVSKHYGLGLTQPELDFVDVDVRNDSLLFIDPRGLLLLETEWGQECVSLIQDFFSCVLDAIHDDKMGRAKQLLGQLHEPNDTRLGMSQGRASGHALGDELAGRVLTALAHSQAVKSGLLTDLEDTILLIEGVGPDLISDVATNVIRQPLIHYTQDVATDLGIPLIPDVASGAMWDPSKKAWVAEYVDLLRADGRRLLLVPKIIVRQRMDYDPDEYFRHYILEQMQTDEIAANTALVHLLKDGTPRVSKTSLVEKYGRGKSVASRVTNDHPQVLDRYRKDKQKLQPPLGHAQLSDALGAHQADFDALLAAVTAVKPGKAGAGTYHSAVMALLNALFYPALSMPKKEAPIHGGRKRIDIRYANSARVGFFWWLAQHYPAAHVFVECKNYAGDPANPELDQLAGRFSPSRGQFGLLVCRSFSDKPKFIASCRDTADDQRGFIVALDDEDLGRLVEARKAGDLLAAFPSLRPRFVELVM